MASHHTTEAAESAVRPQPDTPPPEVWTVAVLRVVSQAEKPLTLREIKRAVGSEVPVPGPAPIEEEVAILTKYDFIVRDDVSGHYSLSDQGVALLTGIDRDAQR